LPIDDALTKLTETDYLRHLLEIALYQVMSEEQALGDRARAKRERIARGEARKKEAETKKETKSTAEEDDEEVEK
jgi:Ran GTPase-activating protein (RanGAP) involved in mRNA processing and transport